MCLKAPLITILVTTFQSAISIPTEVFASLRSNITELVDQRFLVYENPNLGIKLEYPYLWSLLDFKGKVGFWKLNVDNGTINYFYANFSMVHVNGLRYHTHQITNFEPNVVIPIVFDPGGLSFTGMMDIKEDGRVKWIGVQTRELINGFNTIAIYPDTDYIDHHFQNQPIYGVVQTLKDDRRDTFLVDNFL